MPPKIIVAKAVFIANGGGDSNVGRGTASVFSGGPDRAYNEFYAAMKGWGHYELASDPADADLIFKLRLTVEREGQPVEKGQSLGPGFECRLRLVVIDRRTNVLLWALDKYVEWAYLQGNRDRNFDEAMDSLVDDVKRLASPAAAGADGDKSQAAPD